VVKGADRNGDRILYIIHRDHWSDTVLNMQVPSEDKSDRTKDRFYEEQKHVCNQFLKYHM
jgi:hypothetical protein